MSTVGIAPGVRSEHRQARTSLRRSFFVTISAVLVGAVLVGFAPTYYLRAGFEPYLRDVYGPHSPRHLRPLDLSLHLHALVLTAWYAVLLIQSVLAARHRIAAHRRVGMLGMAIAASIPVVTVFVAPGSLGLTLPFASLVAGAYWFRRKPDVHKRLMTVASIVITTPASGRIAAHLIYAGLIEPSSWWLTVTAIQCSFLAAVVVHDVIHRKRIHPATIVGGAVCLIPIWNTLSIAQALR